MLTAIEGWHPTMRAIVNGIDLDSIFAIPFGFLQPGTVWEPSRVTMIGDAAHAMLPTLAMGANLALKDAQMLLERFESAAADGTDVVAAIGAYEDEMRALAYPLMHMTMDHDRSFGGGALAEMDAEAGA
jgi:2-polyprenyl-6-methoxyphenol hydroxylase-like FAD-dependent oxidoreductase